MTELARTGLEQLDPLLEAAYGDVVPSWDFPTNDWPDVPNGRLFPLFVTLQDREEGRCRPLYDNEMDLSRQIASIRRWIGLNELTEAVTTALQVYIFGQGVEVSVQGSTTAGDVPPELVADIRRIVERFSEDNNLINNLDLELHRRSREDGEAILPIEREGNRIICDPVETVQLTEPRVPLDLCDWIEQNHGIDLNSFVPSWRFGVLTSRRRTSRPLGYHIIYDGGGSDWDFFPSEQCVHIKRNVPRSAKRGVSDWLAVRDRVAQSAKLVRNMSYGAALQAAIAWVEQSPAGTTAGQLSGIGSPGQGSQVPNGNGSQRTDLGKIYGPGSILRPTPGRAYVAGPMGAERNAGFEVVEQIIERLIGTRWLMTYPMISGDASQVNFAASLTAEAPFVKAREADQQFYGGAMKSLLWKVVRMAWRLGWLDLRGIPIDWLEHKIDIKVDFTSPATRDRGQLVDQLVKEVGLGVTSLRTASVDLGRDFDEETAAGAKPQAVASSATSGAVQTAPDVQPGEMAGLSAQQFDRNTRALRKILTDFQAGATSRVVAKGLLTGISIPDDKAEGYLDDAAKGIIDAPADPVDATKAAAVQGALESVETTTEALQILESVGRYP